MKPQKVSTGRTFVYTMRRLRIACAALGLVLTLPSGQAAQITWNNAAGGNWSNPSNWTPNQVPGGSDDALLTAAGTYTVVVDVGQTVSNLTVGGSSGLVILSVPGAGLTISNSANFTAKGSLSLSGGTISGTGSITFAGSNYWSGGVFNNRGANTVTASGSFLLDTGGNHDWPGTTWTNAGTFTHTGGQVRGGFGTEFYNNHLWIEQTDNQFNNAYGNGVVTFNNFGTFRKDTATGTSSFEASAFLMNRGTIDAESGNIQINDTGGATSGGTFFANTAGTITFINAYSFTNDNTFYGPGIIQLNTGATLSFNGNIITTNLLWVAGVIQGNITNLAGNVLYLVSASNHDMPNCVFINNGTIIRQQGAVRGGAAGGTGFYNNGLWLDQTDDQFNNGYGVANSTFYNAGTFRKTGSGGTSTFEANFFLINTGTLDAEDGIIAINDAGGTTTGGNFFANTAGEIDFLNAYHFRGDNTFSGPGKVQLDTGAVLSFNGNIITTNLQWVAGVIQGNITNVTGSVLYLVSGNNHDMPNCVFVNNGTIIRQQGAVRGGAAGGTSFYNNGLWLDQTDDQFNNGYGGAGSTFYNPGVLRKTAGTNQTTFEANFLLINSGTVDAESALIVINDAGGSNNGGTFYAGMNGACDLVNAYTLNDGTIFAGPGTNYLDSGGAIVNITGRLTSSNLYWNSGRIAGTPTNTPSSTLYIVSGNNHDLPGAQFENLGTIIRTGGQVRGGLGGIIDNHGLWLDQTDNELNQAFGGGEMFVNNNIFRKTTTTGNTTFQPACLLINNGTVDAQTGTIVINDTGGTNNGTFNAASGATCDVISQYTFSDGTVFSGAGANYIDSGGAIVEFTGGFRSANLYWNSGRVGGTPTNLANSTLYVVSGNNHDLPGTLFGNLGTIIRTGGQVRGGNGGIIDNRGVWLDETDNELNAAFGGGESFVNNNIFIKTNSTATTTFQPGCLLINNGLVNAATGTISVNDGGGNSQGIFRADSGALCHFISSYTFNNGTTFSGAGQNIIDATLTFAGNFMSSNLSWNSGRILGTPTNVIGSTFYIVSANQHDLPGAYLKNLGTIIRTGGQMRGGVGGTIDNAGVWLEQTDNEINAAYGAGESFLNSGTFSKTGTTGASTFQSGTSSTNTGTLQVLSGLVTFNGSYAQNNGTMQFGVTSTASYGKVGLAGPMNFNGTLALSPQGGYTAALGDTLTPLTYASRTAEFGNLNLTPVPVGDAWQVSYNPAALVLTVITPGAAANQITGSVKDAPTHGVPGITVFAFNTNANNQAVYVSAVTDANGLYSLSVSNSTWQVGLANLAAAGYNAVADQTAVVNGANQVINFLIQAIVAVTPTVTTTPATAISQTGATLNGTLNPGGEAVSVYFAYGTGVLDHFTPTNTLTSNLNGIQPQSAVLTGLTPTTQYQFQLVAVNSLGSISGSVLNFTTLGSVPTTITLAPTAIGTTNVTMNGSVNPNGLATSYYFEYGLTTNYGTFSATNVAGAGNTPVLVSDALTNLSPATVYHFQLVGSNSAGTTLGGDLSWTNHNTTPYVTTLAATAVTTTTATLNGSINPNGLATAWYFEFGTDTTYGSFTPTNTVTATNTSQAVASALAGLTPTTIYHFQLVGSNALGIVLGGDFTLTNGVVAPVATTTAATGVSLTGATLNGTINPGGENVKVYFAYGTLVLDQFTPTNTISANLNSTQPQSVPLTGLTPATTYQFQIVAVNSVGTNMGDVFDFTTLGSAPTTVTLPASGIGAANATMNGSVNPGGLATSYYFEYGLTASYGSFTVTNPLGSGTSPLAVASILTNLSPATVYHFQVVAGNSSGTTLGGDLSWTNSNAAPKVTTLAATAIGTSTATLNGAINPNGLDTAWYFEYGTATTYGSFTPTNHLAATNTSQTLASALAGLTPNTTYHFQLVGSNVLGVVLGGDLTITTIPNTTVAAALSCPANITTNTAPGQCVRILGFAPIVMGNPTPTLTCKTGSTVITSPYAFPLGTNIVTCTASNVAGTESCSFTVTVSDTEPPALTCPANITVAAPSGQLGTTVNFAVSATDNCGGALPVKCTPQPGYFAIGQTPVLCEAVDAYSNRATCSFTVTVTAPTDSSRLCSLGQGFYGNAKGRFNGITSLVLVGQLLEQGPLVVGKVGVRSLSILPDEASLLQERLPAGGPPAALPNNGDQTLQTAVLPLNPKLRFADVFLGQTITLSLNTRLSPSLLSFGLASSFCDQGVLAGADGLKGTSDDVPVTNDIQQFTVPGSVLNALLDAALGINDGTVKGLLELANRALAGMPVGSASVADVNAAVDAVNRGFDECRMTVNCGTSTLTEDSFNDDFTTRPTLGSGGPNLLNLEVRSSNLNATKEPGEPELAGNPGGKSVWWQWQAPRSGPVTISTKGSSFDTLLGIYTGTSILNLVLAGANDDDADGGLASVKTFEAQAGINYQITVDGVDGASGEIVMTLVADRPQLCQGLTVVNNRVQFCLNGETGRVYTVEGSPDLVHWTLLATGVSTNGVLGLTDRAMSNFPQRNYRVTFEP